MAYDLEAVLYFCFLPLFFLRENLPGDTRSEPDGQTDTMAQTDGGPRSHPPTGWSSTKNFAFPDELEVQNILQKLSNHSLEKHGDTDSLSSYTSGLSINFCSFFITYIYVLCIYLYLCVFILI